MSLISSPCCYGFMGRLSACTGAFFYLPPHLWRLPMPRVSFFIDGFNVYHSLKNEYDTINGRYRHYKYRKYLWLDFSVLAQRFTRKGDSLGDIFYFSAHAFWKPDSVKRHNIFISALKSRGIKICGYLQSSSWQKKLATCDRICHTLMIFWPQNNIIGGQYEWIDHYRRFSQIRNRI